MMLSCRVLVKADQSASKHYKMRAVMYHDNPWTSAPDPIGLDVNVYANWIYGTKFTKTSSTMLPPLSESTLNELNLSPVVKQMVLAPKSILDEYVQTVQFATLPGDSYQKAYPMIYRGKDKNPVVSSSYVPPSRPTLMALAHDKLSVAQLPKTSNVVVLKQGSVAQITIVNNDGGGNLTLYFFYLYHQSDYLCKHLQSILIIYIIIFSG